MEWDRTAEPTPGISAKTIIDTALENCPICRMRAETLKLEDDRRREKIQGGLSYLTDRKGSLPIKVSLYKRPTAEQWRRMIDLCKEIESNITT